MQTHEGRRFCWALLEGRLSAVAPGSTARARQRQCLDEFPCRSRAHTASNRQEIFKNLLPRKQCSFNGQEAVLWGPITAGEPLTCTLSDSSDAIHIRK
jgi:hypothetical protein